MRQTSLQDKWRPYAAMTYIIISIFDFIVMPIIFNFLQFYSSQEVTPYSPITLSGGGLFHISYGAILGIYTHGRTNEKIKKLEIQNRRGKQDE